MLLYMAARRSYLDGSDSVPMRAIDFSKCTCQTCPMLSPTMNPRSSEVFTYLYIQNLIEANRLTFETKPIPSKRKRFAHEERREKKEKKRQYGSSAQDFGLEFKPAHEK